jgi:hypothetical protein
MSIPPVRARWSLRSLKRTIWQPWWGHCQLKLIVDGDSDCGDEIAGGLQHNGSGESRRPAHFIPKPESFAAKFSVISDG